MENQFAVLVHRASRLKDPSASVLLLYLGDRAAGSWPSAKVSSAQIEADTGMSKHTRKGAQRRLQAAGLLRLAPGTGRAPSAYTLSIEGGQILTTQGYQKLVTQGGQDPATQGGQNAEGGQIPTPLNAPSNERVADAHIGNAGARVSIDGLYSTQLIEEIDRVPPLPASTERSKPPTEGGEQIRRAIETLFHVKHLRPSITDDGIAGQLESLGRREYGANPYQIVAALNRAATYREKSGEAPIEHWGYFRRVIRQNLAAMGLTRKAARSKDAPPGLGQRGQPEEKPASAPAISPATAEKIGPTADRTGLDDMVAMLVAKTGMP